MSESGEDTPSRGLQLLRIYSAVSALQPGIVVQAIRTLEDIAMCLTTSDNAAKMTIIVIVGSMWACFCLSKSEKYAHALRLGFHNLWGACHSAVGWERDRFIRTFFLGVKQTWKLSV